MKMPTFTAQQYQQVQTAQQQIFQLAQQSTLWTTQSIQQQLITAYNALDAIATYIAAQGSN